MEGRGVDGIGAVWLISLVKRGESPEARVPEPRNGQTQVRVGYRQIDGLPPRIEEGPGPNDLEGLPLKQRQG